MRSLYNTLGETFGCQKQNSRGRIGAFVVCVSAHWRPAKLGGRRFASSAHLTWARRVGAAEIRCGCSRICVPESRTLIAIGAYRNRPTSISARRYSPPVIHFFIRMASSIATSGQPKSPRSIAQRPPLYLSGGKGVRQLGFAAKSAELRRYFSLGRGPAQAEIGRFLRLAPPSTLSARGRV